MDYSVNAYNRGRLDSYYRRPRSPHYYTEGNIGMSKCVTELTPEEKEAYLRGYKDNDDDGDFKDYGNNNMPLGLED